MKKTIFLTATAFSLLSFAITQAQSAIHEGFDYDVGNLNAAGNGSTTTGFTGDWAGDSRYQVGSGSIGYGSLQTTGNKLVINNSGGGMHRIAAGVSVSPSLLSDSSTLWFSFLLTTYEASANDSFILALATDPWAPGEAAQAGQAVGFQMANGGDTQAQFWNSNAFVGSPSGTTDLVPDSWTGGESATQLIVGRIDWGIDGSTADTLSLFNVGTDLSLPGSAFSTASFDATQGNFDTLAMTGRVDLIADVDEIRFGGSYADVTQVPEPSAFALLAGIFGLTWIMVRRRA